MMSHVGLRTIQQPLKFQSVSISICNDIANLSNYCRENEHPDEIADDREHVSVQKRLVNTFVTFRLLKCLIE